LKYLSEYAVLLSSDNWQIVRKRILKRDNYKCKECGKSNCRLNVHHKIYLEGKKPWEVPDRFLVSLCDECHAKAHENRLIKSFVKKNVLKKKKRVNRKKSDAQSLIWVGGKGIILVK
jgi:Restriction endonuclease